MGGIYGRHNRSEMYFLLVCIAKENYSMRTERTTKFGSRSFEAVSLDMFTCK
jgi:hypothetical protein